MIDLQLAGKTSIKISSWGGWVRPGKLLDESAFGAHPALKSRKIFLGITYLCFLVLGILFERRFWIIYSVVSPAGNSRDVSLGALSRPFREFFVFFLKLIVGLFNEQHSLSVKFVAAGRAARRFVRQRNTIMAMQKCMRKYNTGCLGNCDPRQRARVPQTGPLEYLHMYFGIAAVVKGYARCLARPVGTILADCGLSLAL